MDTKHFLDNYGQSLSEQVLSPISFVKDCLDALIINNSPVKIKKIQVDSNLLNIGFTIPREGFAEILPRNNKAKSILKNYHIQIMIMGTKYPAKLTYYPSSNQRREHMNVRYGPSSPIPTLLKRIFVHTCSNLCNGDKKDEKSMKREEKEYIEVIHVNTNVIGLSCHTINDTVKDCKPNIEYNPTSSTSESNVNPANNDTSIDLRFEPLRRYIVADGNDVVGISFEKITELVGELPGDAYENLSFWSNSGAGPLSCAWINAGYKVVYCNLLTQYVGFGKDKLNSGDGHEKLRNIITTKFKNGFRVASTIDFERFKDYYLNEYSEPFNSGRAVLDSFISKESLIYDGRAYIYNEDTANYIRALIESLDSPCIFIDYFFTKCADELFTYNIYSVDMLKVFIDKVYSDIIVKRDYILLDVYTNPQDLIKEIFKVREVWTVNEIEDRLPYLKAHTIEQTMRSSEYFHVDKGTYVHIDNIDLPDYEGEKIITTVENALQLRDYITANELDLSTFKKLNPHCSFTAIRDAVFYKFLSDSYEKRGQVISRKGVVLRVKDILEEFCRNADTVTFSELSDLEASISPKGKGCGQSLQAGHEVMVRVNEDLFVSHASIKFDITKIDEVISLYCNKDFIPLKRVTDFTLFPFAGYPWNRFLLESYVRKFSGAFTFEVRSLNSTGNGAIVRKSFNYNSYDDILSHALARALINLNDKRAIKDYLFDNGYIGRRKLGKSGGSIIKNAIKLKEKGMF